MVEREGLLAGHFATLVETTKISEQLVDQCEVTTGCRCFAVDKVELPASFKSKRVDVGYHAIVVESDGDDLAFRHFRLKKSECFGLVADVIPELRVDHRGCRWRAQNPRNVIPGVGAWDNLGESVWVELVAPRIKTRRASSDTDT